MCFAPQRRALFWHFFDIWTSKSGPRPSVFNTFDLEMCFAPQRRALFRHRNFQKWSGPGVFCAFSLGNVLRATTACTFSTSQLPKVVRRWGVLYILTWKCASRHNGVQFFIVPVASWVRTRRFSEPTFRPSGATNHWKNTVFRDFPTFSRICIFCPLTLSLLIFSLLIFLFSLPLPCSAFHLSILSEVWLLNFLRLNYIKLWPNHFWSNTQLLISWQRSSPLPKRGARCKICQCEKEILRYFSGNIYSEFTGYPQIYPGWWFQPLWKIWVRQLRFLFPIYEKIFQTTNQHPFNLWNCGHFDPQKPPFRPPQRGPQCGLHCPRSAWSHCLGWCHKRSSFWCFSIRGWWQKTTGFPIDSPWWSF